LIFAMGGEIVLAAEEGTDPVAIHRNMAASTTLPFSFVYGGRPSSELVGQWKRTDDEKSLDAATLEHTVTLSDPATALEVRAVFKIYTDAPAVDWTLYFTNRGEKDTPVLEDIRAVDTSAKRSGSVMLHRLTGSKCVAEDWLPLEDALPAGKRIESAPEGGWSSSGASPFFTVQWPGGGVVTAIGWSGQWNATVERGTDDGVWIRAGMQFAHLKLHPGETIRCPRIMQCYPREQLKQAIAEAKRLRKYFFGDFYVLTKASVEPGDWCVLQYHRLAEQDGMVVLFRRPDSSFAAYELRDLREIAPEADYEVTTSRGYESSATMKMKGSELQRWKCELDGAPESSVLEYRRLK
jgi:hypothetical protein